MKQSPAYRPSRSIRVFTACFLSLLMLLAPMAPLAASVSRTAVARAEQKAARTLAKTAKRHLTAQEALERSLFVNSAPPPGPVIGATLTDSFQDTSPADGMADPGSTVTYTAVISNTGGSDATGVSFADTIDLNTTLVGGSVKVSPLAFADAYGATTDTQLVVGAPGVLTNDTGTATLTVAGITTPVCGDAVAPFDCTTSQGGTVSLAADGSFTYTSASGFSGTDTFTYTATNGQAPNDTATVTLTVAPPNSPPTAVDDSRTVNEDASATALSVLANDTDPDGGAKNIASFTTPTNGTVVGVGPSGAFTDLTYTPNANYCNNPPGSTLDTFTYTLNGGSVGTVSMTVTCVNDAPTITDTKPAAVTMSEDGSPTPFSLTLHATDADPGDTLTWSISSPATHGTATASGTGASKAIGYTPNANYFGSDSFTVQVSDGNGGTDTIIVNVTISSVNDAPTITNSKPAAVIMSEDGSPTPFALTLNATDVDGDTLTWSISSPASNGTATASGTGPSKAIGYTPNANFFGSDSFTVQVSDGNGGTDTIIVNVTINSVNDAPTITNSKPAAVSMSEDGSPTPFSLTLNATDVEGDTLTWSISSPASHGAATASGTGPSKAIGYAPNANYNGADSFTVQVSDGNGGSDTIIVNVNIVAVNDAPTITDSKPAAVTMSEDSSPTAFSLTLHATDADGDTLTWSISSPATNGTATASGTGASKVIGYTPNSNYNGSDSFTVQVSDGNGGTDTIIVNVTINPVNDAPVVDLNGVGVGVNVAPTFTEDSGGAILAGSTDVTDVDNANLVSATITLTNRPDGNGVESLSADTTGTLIIANYTAATGVLALTGTDTLANYQQVLRTVTYNNTSQNPTTTNRIVNFVGNDGTANSATAVATVTVIAVNDAPVLTASGGFTYTENDAATAIAPAITVTDVDSTTLTQATITISANYQSAEDVLSFINGGGMGNIAIQSNTGGVLTLTSAGGTATLAQWQTALQAVKYNNTSEDPSTLQRTVTFQVNDGGAVNNLSNTVSRTITVVAVNDPPTANGFSGLAAQAGIPISYPVGKLGGSDVAAEAANGSTVTINTTPNSNCAGCLVTINANGSFTFTPPPSAAGTTVQFTYHVTDTGNPAPGVDSAAATVSFSVAGPAIYFVKQAPVGAGNCTLLNECTLATAISTIGATVNTRIFIEDNGTYGSVVPLNSNGWLIGQGVTGTTFDALFGIVAPVGGGTLATRPSLGQPSPTISVSSAGNEVTLTSAGTTNSVRGLNLTTGSGTTKGISGTTFGTLTTSDIVISGSGPALDLTTGSLSGSFTSISSSGGTNNIKLTTIGGSSTLGSGALSGATGDSFLVSGGAGTFTYSGPITSGSAHSVNIGSMTGGSVTFSGLITDNDTGITLTNNAGATIGFTGGLALSTGASTAFNATGGGPAATTGGTINVTGATNIITTTTGTALNVVNTTIGASGLPFQKISATGSSGNAGIVLDNTGTSGSLTVAGTGGSCTSSATCTGGTISNKTGANILSGSNTGGQTASGTGGTGIFLRSTSNPSFSNMQLNDFTNFAIYGNNVTGFNLTNSNINGTSGDNNAGDREEGAIRFDNLHTSASFPNATITNSSIGGGATDNVLVYATSGTLNRLSMTNNTFGLISSTIGNSNVFFAVYNNGTTANVTVNNNTFNGTRADFFSAQDNQNSTMDVVARQNKFLDGQTLIPGGGTAIHIAGGSGGNVSAATTTFDISCNRMNGGDANAYNTVGIFVSKGQDGGTLTGSIVNNVIGPAKTGANADGIFVRAAGSNTATVLIQDNTISGYGNAGIHLQNNDGSSTMNATIFGNTESSPNAANFSGIFVDNGATATDTSTMNVVIGSSGTAALQNTLHGVVIDASLSNFNASTHFNLYKNGSASGTTTAVIQDDNVGSPTVDTSGGAGAITLVAAGLPTAPTTPATCATVAMLNDTPDQQYLVSTDNRPVRATAPGIETGGDKQSAQSAALRPIAAAVASTTASRQAKQTDHTFANRAGSVVKMQQPMARTSVFANHRSGALRTDAQHAVIMTRLSDKPITPLSGEMVNVNIGTLPAGKSVTITFQVTLNTAMPSGTNQVSTQGTVTYDSGPPPIANPDGGNAGAANGLGPDAAVQTDDPATPALGDATVTPIDAPTAAGSSVSGRILDSNGNPVEGAGIRMSGTQNRLTVTDAQGNYHFDNVETNGFYTVIATRANFSFSPSQRSFSALGQNTDAAFNASPTGSTLNPLDTTEYFVRQQYVDFLNREPDEAGLNFWYNNIESCGNDAQCRAGKRIDTSAAFFLSTEFQQTGYLVYKSYQAAFGDLPGMPVPVRLSEFKPDTQEIGQGVVVNAPGWDTTLAANKLAFMAEFVQRSRFASAFPSSMTPSDFVNKLFANAGVTPSDSDRAAAVSEFGSAGTSSDVAARGRALQRVAENSMLTQQEFTQAFVLIQYFGYLRRDPNVGPDTDFSGYNFWLQKLNTFNGNFGDAEMVKSFLVSGEYRGRFPR